MTQLVCLWCQRVFRGHVAVDGSTCKRCRPNLPNGVTLPKVDPDE